MQGAGQGDDPIAGYGQRDLGQRDQLAHAQQIRDQQLSSQRHALSADRRVDFFVKVPRNDVIRIARRSRWRL